MNSCALFPVRNGIEGNCTLIKLSGDNGGLDALVKQHQLGRAVHTNQLL